MNGKLTAAAFILLHLTACTAAFEAGEALNRATNNISTDPARYLWSRDPDSIKPTTAASSPAIVPSVEKQSSVPAV